MSVNDRGPYLGSRVLTTAVGLLILLLQGCPDDDHPSTTNSETTVESTGGGGAAAAGTGATAATGGLKDGCVPYEEARRAVTDPIASLTCPVPSPPPAPTNGTYTHHFYAVPYPDATHTWFVDTDFESDYHDSVVATSANGARSAFVTTFKTHAGTFPRYGKLYVFSSGSDSPIWTYDESLQDGATVDTFVPTFSQVAISGCGRVIALRDQTRVHFFTCDNSTPTVTWEAMDDCAFSPRTAYTRPIPNVGTMAMSRDGNYVAVPVEVQDTQSGTLSIQNYIAILRRDQPRTWQRIKLPAGQPSALSLSADGQRLAVLLTDINPTDPTKWGERSNGDSALLLFENGQLSFNLPITNVCDACATPRAVWSKYALAMSADGSTVVAGGPAGKLVNIDSVNGTVRWLHQGTNNYLGSSVSADTIRKVAVSDDGSVVAAMTQNACKGAEYYDASNPGVPRFNSADSWQPSAGSATETPAPNGFPTTNEPNTNGLFVTGASGSCKAREDQWKLSDHLLDLELSGDGQFMTVGSDQFAAGPQGHIYAIHSGSPVPFQSFSEPASDALGPNSRRSYTDSSFIAHALSQDGAWLTAIAFGSSVGETGASTNTFRVHTFEVPPGEVLQVHNTVVVDVNGKTGQILDWLTENGTVSMDYYLAKPGRAAVLTTQLHHTTAVGDTLFDICVPWETSKDWVYPLAEGFGVVHKALNWDTPTCATSLNGVNAFVLRSRLLSAEGALLDQSYANYVSISLTPQ